MSRSGNKGLILLILSYVAFISLGMPDGLTGVAWPGIRETFGLPIDAIGLVMICGTVGYSLSGFFSGVTVRWLGVGGLLALSCALTSSTLLLYGLSPRWIFFPLGSLLGGIGAGAIDAGVNHYVEKHYSERMMQWLHGSFGIGITAGPLIMTLGLEQSGSWRTGYFVVCAVQAMLAGIFFLSRRLWAEDSLQGEGEDTHSAEEASLKETLKQSGAWLSMIIFLLYVGAEIGLGLWVYSLLTESRGVALAVAGMITGSYWGAFTAGRFLAGWYTKKLRPRQILYGSIFAALLGTLILMFFRSAAGSVAGVALTGFSIAPIFPSLVSDTENRVGRAYVGHTIGMQLSASGLGAAFIPLLAGVLARHFGLEVISPYLGGIFLLLLVCLWFSGRKNSLPNS
ncbi:MAG: MFS transporter [Spirochaetales bacterium]|nr:MFS transporter [Spirochaetales bacterium]